MIASTVKNKSDSARQSRTPQLVRDHYLTHSHGIMSWFGTLDHKRIGVMYLVGILAAFLLGGIIALIIRLELFTPGKAFLSEDRYNELFTLHGAIMTFVFIIPSIAAALGNFLIPLMLGQKDVAFPRLNLASFYFWLGGAIFFLIAMLVGGLDTGWTFYTPYSTTTSSTVIAATFGVFVLGFSSIFTGINFIVTINTMRPAGMTWFKMPLMLWALYATSIIQVLATPVLGITVVLLTAESLFGIGIFDPQLGGDPVLYQHFFWFYSHPAVYIMILPAMGIISELISVFSRKPIFGYRFIAFSSIAIALLGFLVWGHHMFTSGQSKLSAIIFGALTFSVAIPSGIKVFNWLATMYKGSIRLATPMCYALSFIFLFTIGGLTGLFLGALATDVHLHDTYFVVAHFHYVMMGGTLIAFLGGLHYWWPKMFGRMYSELWARISCLVIFAGFNLTFFPQFIMGSRGMPRRYARYDPEFEIFHQMSTIGSLVLGVGLVLCAGVLIHSLFRGRRAADNPWGAATLEWQTPSPPPHDNFDRPMLATDPYDYRELAYDDDEHGFVERRQDTVVLLFSSLTMAWAVRCAQLDQQRGLLRCLAITLVCGGFFLGVKAVEYSAKWDEGLLWAGAFAPTLDHVAVMRWSNALTILSVPALTGLPLAVGCGVLANRRRSHKALVMSVSVAATCCAFLLGAVAAKGITYAKHQSSHESKRPDDSAATQVAAEAPEQDSAAEPPRLAGVFFSIYYGMTGVHALHMILGMGFLAWLLWSAQEGRFGSRYFTPVDNFGLYWHLVDLVWIYLFPLLYLIH